MKCDGTGKTADDEFEEKLREATAKIGMVYFVRDDINQRIKIGTALNPLERLRALQTGSSVRLRLMASVAAGARPSASSTKPGPGEGLRANGSTTAIARSLG